MIIKYMDEELQFCINADTKIQDIIEYIQSILSIDHTHYELFSDSTNMFMLNRECNVSSLNLSNSTTLFYDIPIPYKRYRELFD